MHQKPLISIVIPTDNRVTPTLEAIWSVLQQTYENIEVIVVKWMPVAPGVAVSRLASRFPVFKHLGVILLVRADRPRRLPQEGIRRVSYFGAKMFYRLYKRMRGESPLWSRGDGRI